MMMPTWIYYVAAVVIIGFLLVSMKCKAESFYSTIAPPKNFPEVIGLPLYDAKAYLSKYEDTYTIRTVSTYNASYQEDLSTIYIVVDDNNVVTNVL